MTLCRWTKKYESEQEANGVAKQLVCTSCLVNSVVSWLHVLSVTVFYSQGPWLNYFIDIANTYPYLWALYAVGLVMPFVLCAACCVRTKVSAA